jgi:hypothetical protein
MAVRHASIAFLIPHRVPLRPPLDALPACASTVSSENDVRRAELYGNTPSLNPPSSLPRRVPQRPLREAPPQRPLRELSVTRYKAA